MPKTGILDTITEGQQLQLLTWLETLPITEVVQKVAATPPDGFGIKTYITSLRRFQARMNREARAELLENLGSGNTSSGERHLLLKSAEVLTRRFFGSGRASVTAIKLSLLPVRSPAFRRSQCNEDRLKAGLQASASHLKSGVDFFARA